MNGTYVVLIPKVEKPELLFQMRPISLCNVYYKVVSKLIVTKLKPLIAKLLSFC